MPRSGRPGCSRPDARPCGSGGWVYGGCAGDPGGGAAAVEALGENGVGTGRHPGRDGVAEPRVGADVPVRVRACAGLRGRGRRVRPTEHRAGASTAAVGLAVGHPGSPCIWAGRRCSRVRGRCSRSGGRWSQGGGVVAPGRENRLPRGASSTVRIPVETGAALIARSRHRLRIRRTTAYPAGDHHCHRHYAYRQRYYFPHPKIRWSERSTPWRPEVDPRSPSPPLPGNEGSFVPPR